VGRGEKINMYYIYEDVETNNFKFQFYPDLFDTMAIWMTSSERRKEEGFDFHTPEFAEGKTAKEVKTILVELHLAYKGSQGLGANWYVTEISDEMVFLSKVYKQFAEWLFFWKSMNDTKYQDIMIQLHDYFDKMAYVICQIEEPYDDTSCKKLLHGCAMNNLKDVWRHL